MPYWEDPRFGASHDVTFRPTERDLQRHQAAVEAHRRLDTEQCRELIAELEDGDA